MFCCVCNGSRGSVSPMVGSVSPTGRKVGSTFEFFSRLLVKVKEVKCRKSYTPDSIHPSIQPALPSDSSHLTHDHISMSMCHWASKSCLGELFCTCHISTSITVRRMHVSLWYAGVWCICMFHIVELDHSISVTCLHVCAWK